jgi:reactive intermediate/imine deaminase
MTQNSKSNVQFFPAERADAPYSSAVRVGNLLFLSGMLGTDSSGQLAKGGIGPETKQTMENIRAALQRYGSSFDQVVKVTVMLADIGEWQAMNDVYLTFFATHRPARSAFGASGLARNGRVEIECIAVIP